MKLPVVQRAWQETGLSDGLLEVTHLHILVDVFRGRISLVGIAGTEA